MSFNPEPGVNRCKGCKQMWSTKLIMFSDTQALKLSINQKRVVPAIPIHLKSFFLSSPAQYITWTVSPSPFVYHPCESPCGIPISSLLTRTQDFQAYFTSCSLLRLMVCSRRAGSTHDISNVTVKEACTILLAAHVLQLQAPKYKRKDFWKVNKTNRQKKFNHTNITLHKLLINNVPI